MAEYSPKTQLYKGKLHEYCQKHKIQLDYKDVKVDGPPHDRVFTVMVVINGKEYPPATGKNKKDAKEKAAKAAWNIITQPDGVLLPQVLQLQPSPSPSPPPPPPPPPVSSSDEKPHDYLSLLSHYGQKNKKKIDYVLKEECGLPHKKTFSYVCKIDDKIYGEGTGNDKKAAKQAAAKCAYEQLTSEETSMRHTPVANSANSGLSNSNDMSDSSSACCTDSSSKNGNLLNKMNGMTIDEPSSSPGTTPKNAAVKSKRENTPKLAPTFSGAQVKEENKYTKNERFSDDFEEIEPIGSGGFGNVFKAKKIIDKKSYAIKKVMWSGKVHREVEALAKLEHKNIVRYYTSWRGNDYIYSENSSSLSRPRPDLLCDCLFIQMEFCEKGTLDGWIDKKRGTENYQAESLIKFRQIVTGVEYMHSKEFIHRDLKPLNIFISSEDKIKIGDFGLVTSMTDDLRTTEKGTRSYMSPEQKGDTYGPEVDIFALGLILFEILWIFPTRVEKNKKWEQIRNCIFPEEFNKKFPTEKYIIEQLLSINVEKRPSASDVLELLELVDKKNPNSARTY
ncbi:interferon-induced, double-stranded RNA-activated protein kinase isoform X2 [Pelodiscus sinensis]|uniref:interferon-induced, double-stranded RNA-activated protein kinase isoform X2 n=1 Tax=Pelodiscus sinensis TaxID=13735 RepID=UPI003F6D11A9